MARAVVAVQREDDGAFHAAPAITLTLGCAGRDRSSVMATRARATIGDRRTTPIVRVDTAQAAIFHLEF